MTNMSFYTSIGGQEYPNFPNWFVMVCNGLHGLDMAYQRQAKTTKIQTNFFQATKPNASYPTQFSRFANLHANQFISSYKPAFSSVQTVCKPMPNHIRILKPLSVRLLCFAISLDSKYFIPISNRQAGVHSEPCAAESPAAAPSA